ncbi:endo alpha-1,4 polygalactosaminidase [Alsobacter sp. SYSU BS001988]
MPKTGMYVLQSIVPSEVAAAPFDVKVIDAYNDNGVAFTAAQVAQMGGGAGGGLLLGYFSIGEGETYRDYFSSIPAAALGPENPDWAGNYEVAYWTAEWRAVATAYVDRLIKAGYDGAYFDVVDECQTSWAKTHAPGGAAGAEAAMVDLVKYLADYAYAQNPAFKIWANNAEELLTNSVYLNTLDGMFKENLYYQDTGAKQPASETAYSLSLLNAMIAAGKDVIAIEYVSGAAKIADAQTQAARDGVGVYIAHLDLKGIDYDGVTASAPTAGVPAPSPDLTLTGDAGANVLKGAAGDDHLYGGAGDDTLQGGSGDDWLAGGSGHDRMTGGAGADVFVFSAKAGNANADVITDFQHGIDHIALDHRLFAGLATGAMADSAFTVGKAAQDAFDRLMYNRSTGALSYDPDGVGGAGALKIATLQTGLTLDAHDFWVF